MPPVTDTGSQPDPLHALAAALETVLGLAPCAGVAELRALQPVLAQDAEPKAAGAAPDGPAPKKGAGFVVGGRIRVGNHYDLQPAITIYDPDLGTLAFVEHISRTEDAAEGAAWAAIERATAVRQILIDEAARQQQALDADAAKQRKPKVRMLPLQVELVLLVSGAVRDAESRSGSHLPDRRRPADRLSASRRPERARYLISIRCSMPTCCAGRSRGCCAARRRGSADSHPPRPPPGEAVRCRSP